MAGYVVEKVCCSCSVLKSAFAFGRYAKSQDGLQPKCRKCKGLYDKANYAANVDTYIDRGKAWRQARAKENHDLVEQYYSTHPCVDCGESDVDMLQFDHVQGDKIDNISSMVTSGRSWDLIEAEIEKCEVRCANHHQKITKIRRRGVAQQ